MERVSCFQVKDLKIEIRFSELAHSPDLAKVLTDIERFYLADSGFICAILRQALWVLALLAVLWAAAFARVYFLTETHRIDF